MHIVKCGRVGYDYCTIQMTRWLIALATYIAGVYNHSIECDNCQSICVQCKI